MPPVTRLTPDALDGAVAAVRTFVDDHHLAGAVTMVWQGGDVVRLDTLGHADLAADRTMSRDTIFRIASMTKPITSLAALMLVEEGRLRLDDPISRWLPEFAQPRVLVDPEGPLDRTVPAPRAITVEDLMTHRAGLAYSFTGSPALAVAYEERLGPPLDAPDPVDAWLGELASLPLQYPPGERFHYSHATDVLGFLVARIEDAPLGEVLRDRILAPLGMRDTTFWVPGPEQGRIARLYRATPDGPTPLTDVTPDIPATPPGAGAFESGGGGLFSTVDDYLRFARLLLGRGEVDGVRLVSQETVDLLTTDRLTPAQHAIPTFGLPMWSSQGFGLGVSTVQDADLYEAMGGGAVGAFGWPGAFGTWWQADPAHDMVLIYLVQDRMQLGPEAVTAAPRRPTGRLAQFAFQKAVHAALT